MRLDFEQNCATASFDPTRSIFVNCTLQKSPDLSGTQGLSDTSASLVDRPDVACNHVWAFAHDTAICAYPDMTERGWASDEWPSIYERIMAADILVLPSPGLSYLDEGYGRPDYDFTNSNTAFMTYNLMHLAPLLRGVGGIPDYGNQRAQWDADARFGRTSPEYR